MAAYSLAYCMHWTSFHYGALHCVTLHWAFKYALHCTVALLDRVHRRSDSPSHGAPGMMSPVHPPRHGSYVAATLLGSKDVCTREPTLKVLFHMHGTYYSNVLFCLVRCLHLFLCYLHQSQMKQPSTPSQQPFPTPQTTRRAAERF